MRENSKDLIAELDQVGETKYGRGEFDLETEAALLKK